MNFLQNGIVARLSESDQRLLLRRCKEVHLEVGDIIAAPGTSHDDVYFLTGASIALVIRDESRAGLAVGLIGHEGAVGLQFALGLGAGVITLQVQSAGTAWRVRGSSLQRLIARRSVLLLLFCRYMWSASQDVAAMAACSQIQDVKARFAAWVLLSAIRSNCLELLLTHAHVANMLGVRRASVTLAAVELKAMGLLDYSRGRIHILDFARLKAVSCWTPAHTTIGRETMPPSHLPMAM